MGWYVLHSYPGLWRPIVILCEGPAMLYGVIVVWLSSVCLKIVASEDLNGANALATSGDYTEAVINSRIIVYIYPTCYCY